MKAASIHELKKEVNSLPVAEVVELCLRLAKYKKENKELLHYLLFEANDEASYIKKAKTELSSQFTIIDTNNIYLAKKTLRKILRNTNKYIKYAGSKPVEIELLLFFCRNLKQSRLPLSTNATIQNIYLRQTQKITKAIAQLHDDLQYDYRKELNPLLHFLL